ncbi:hypothetical protein ACN6LA_006630, partial [Streptomyces sp. SAS_269]
MAKTKEHAVSLVYPCCLPLSTHTLTYLADLLRRHLKAIRSRWRALSSGRIATIVLAVLRHDQRLADMDGLGQAAEDVGVYARSGHGGSFLGRAVLSDG